MFQQIDDDADLKLLGDKERHAGRRDRIANSGTENSDCGLTF